MGPYTIRIVGDPVLKQRAVEIDDVDAGLIGLSEAMLETMYAAPGMGLAAPQVGIQRRLFVYDVGEGPRTLINPTVSESRGEWEFEEGCLSIPDMEFSIVRPKEIHLTGYDLDGNEVSVEADELLARLLQHELDHLDGILMLEHLDDEQRNEAKRAMRELALRGPSDRAAGSAPRL